MKKARIKKLLEFNDSTASDVPVVVSFLRSNAAALLATIVDFSMLIFLREVMSFEVVIATILGFMAGSCVSFTLTRNWAFERKDGKVTHQASKFLLTAAIGLVLNTLGVWLITSWLGDQYYLIARAVTAVIVGFGYSFVMYRYFVFK